MASLTFYRTIPAGPDAQIPGRQFYKAATSSWANYRAAQRGRSKADFTAKLAIAVEEADEALGWLEFMRDGGIAVDAELLSEAKQLRSILGACLVSARKNAR